LNTVEVLVYDYHLRSYGIELNVKVSKYYKKIINELINKAFSGEIGYPARIYINDYGMGCDCNFHLYGEVQLMIPYNFYVQVMKRFDKSLGNNIAGIDVNVDRINLVIINEDEKLLDKKTFRFSEVTSRGFPRKTAWSVIGQAIHECLRYAYHHGVSTIVLENPKIIGYLKYFWIRNKEDRKHEKYNYKISIFRNSIIERISWKAPLYALQVTYVSPKGTSSSKEHKEIMRKFGLDKHTVSAILIARKGILKLSK